MRARKESSFAETRFAAFDTTVRIRAYGAATCMDAALEEARMACHLFEELFSRTIPTSDVSRLNEAQGAWVTVDPRTFALIEAALRYCEASEGAFDITIGSASRLWDLKRSIAPTAEELAEAMEHVDWRLVALDAQRSQVRLEDPRAMIDLGGIAKGWVADSLESLLKSAGAHGWVIDLGGNILVGGEKPDGAPWKVALPRIPGSTDAVRQITLRRGSVVTSGTYERACTIDGVRCHHILSPQTGRPVSVEYQAATVVCERSIDAEGFSTTLLALGPERARTLQRAHPEILQVYFTR